jgi:hypothetical protein
MLMAVLHLHMTETLWDSPKGKAQTIMPPAPHLFPILLTYSANTSISEPQQLVRPKMSNRTTRPNKQNHGLAADRVLK